MAETNLTLQQQAAVDHAGGTLLVSAAAGSGKTMVLVERIMKRVTDPDRPVNIDEFLIITYTRKAAAELRAKIARELTKRLAEAPGNRLLARQIKRLHLAQISTVHAFCTALLRRFAVEADIPADFRVAEEDRAQLLLEQAMRDELEARYGAIDADPDFSALVNDLGYGRSDARLTQVLTELYHAVRCRPDPEAWMRACLEQYELADGTTAEQTVWGRALMEERRQMLDALSDILLRGKDVCLRDDVLAKRYLPAFEKDLQLVRTLLAADTWDACFAQAGAEASRLGSSAGCQDEAAKQTAKKLHELAVKQFKAVGTLFYADSATVLRDLSATLPALRGLMALLRAIDTRFAQEKRQRKLLDYSDLEQLSIRLLTDRATGRPTQAAREVAKDFREILIDEYQDSNEVQECIFRAVSDGGRNLFFVGDVKQSIYRFRLADPTIFLRKYNAYPLAEDAAPGDPCKLLLAHNFRSRPEILSAVNDVFGLVMSRQSGEMDYTAQEALHPGPGREFPPADGARVELHYIDYQASPGSAPEMQEGEDENPDKTNAEAGFVAARIAKLLADGASVTDQTGVLRPAQPGDIAVLLRSTSMSTAIYQRALARYGIRCVTGRSGNLFDTAECELLMQLLAVVDNPHRDIELLGVLISPVFCVSPDELAAVRAADRRSDLYDCLTGYKDPPEHIRAFLAWLAGMRQLAHHAELPELLQQILASTQLETVLSSMDDGARRTENLHTLTAQLQADMLTDAQSLCELVHMLEERRQQGRMYTSDTQQSRSDAVTIMSIHSSKGLEFPIVVLADTARRFRLDSAREPVLTDDELGAATKVVDFTYGAIYPNIAYLAVSHKKRAQLAAEEMRILYVAMTRAKDLLIMTCCTANLDAYLAGKSALLSDPLSGAISAGAIQMSDWLTWAALCRTEAGALFAVTQDSAFARVREHPWRITCTQGPSQQFAARGEQPDQPALRPSLDMEQLTQAVCFRYGHEAASRLPSKLTATELKGRAIDREAAEEATEQLPAAKGAWRLPEFAERQLTAAERGSATHLFMQFVQYESCTDPEGIDRELARLVERRFLTEQQAKAVDRRKILTLFRSPFGQRILQAKNMEREFKFSILTDAADFSADASGEQVLLQGVVDCFWREADGLVVVDYKTDYVNNNLDEVTQRYRPQLRAYAHALSRIFETPVKETILYFFSVDSPVPVK